MSLKCKKCGDSRDLKRSTYDAYEWQCQACMTKNFHGAEGGIVDEEKVSSLEMFKDYTERTVTDIDSSTFAEDEEKIDVE